MKHTRWIAFVLLLTAGGARAQSDKAVQVAKGLFRERQDSVIYVVVVAKMEMSAGGRTQNRDQKIEALGTVIDATGLTVVSYSAIDPGAAARGRIVNTPSGPVTLQVKTEFAEVKLHLSDGTEVPATVVLKDTDLDLAFLRPDAASDEAKAATFKPVDLKDDAKADVMSSLSLVAPGPGSTAVATAARPSAKSPRI